MQWLRDLGHIGKAPVLELGYAGLFFNRTCFSGVIGAGPIGGISQGSPYKINCRFNKTEIIKSIMTVAKLSDRFDVIYGDGISFIEGDNFATRHVFTYIDPPYVLNGHKMYRYFFNEKEHERLAAAVAKLRVPWLLSYDDCTLVRRLYEGESASLVKTYQSLNGARSVNEMLIASPDFELPGQQPLTRHEIAVSNARRRNAQFNLVLDRAD